MKQIFRDRKGKIVVDDVPVPALDRGKVLVEVLYSVISSGTESRSLLSTKKDFSQKLKNPLSVIRVVGKASRKGLPSLYRNLKSKLSVLAPLGYSCAGKVINVGDDVRDIAEGDLVACMSAEYAYHAEYLSIPRNLVVKIPQPVEMKDAAFTMIGCIALHAVRNIRVQLGEHVVVVGLGLIGQIVVQLLKLSGAKVYGIDTLPNRIVLAKKLGLDEGIVLKPSYQLEDVMSWTQGTGADAVLVCTTNTQHDILRKTAAVCRDKARFVVVGSFDLHLPYELFYRKELEFIVSRSSGPGRYDESFESANHEYPIGYVRWTERRNAEEFLSLLATKKLRLQELITREYPLMKAHDAYAALLKHDHLGIMLSYGNQKPSTSFVTTVPVTPQPLSHEKISVAVAGLGVFAKNVQLPELANNSHYRLHTVVSKSGVQAKEVAKKFSASYCTTDYAEMLKNPDVQLVIITTRNNQHASMAIEAAQAGKHIFLEKPMAMNYREMKDIILAVQKNKVFFTLGLNRRFSPLAQAAKDILSQHQKPALIIYRFQDERAADRAWVENLTEGGGRVLHLCGHMVDVCSWLLNADPLDVFTKSVEARTSSVVNQDNVIMTSNFSDGSVATMIYSSLGNSALERERIEIYFDNKVIILKNYQSLEFIGIDRKNITLPEPDNGYTRQLAEIAKRLQGDQSAENVSLADAVRSQVFCLRALESLQTKKTLPMDYQHYLRGE